MRAEIAKIVFPFFCAGLRLRQRLMSRHADSLDLQKEQTELKGLLLATPNARDAQSDYLGDNSQGDVFRSQYESFLGIRYALACWIDEIMIKPNLPWCKSWNENKLESQLFGGNLRAEKFWDQAKRAANRSSRDPLEVCYLCVVLGFRGEWENQPDKVKDWKNQVEAQVTEDREWKPPPEQKVKPHVPMLTGVARKQSMFLAVTISALLIFPLLAIIGIILLLRS